MTATQTAPQSWKTLNDSFHFFSKVVLKIHPVFALLCSNPMCRNLHVFFYSKEEISMIHTASHRFPVAARPARPSPAGRSSGPSPKHHGRPPAPERQTLNGILHFLTTGCSWLDLPYPEYPSYSVCYRVHQSWLGDGTWAAIIDALVRELHIRTGVDLWAEWTRFISIYRSADAAVSFEISPVVFTSDSDCVVVLAFLLNLLEILAGDRRNQLLLKNRFPAYLTSAGNVQSHIQQ